MDSRIPPLPPKTSADSPRPPPPPAQEAVQESRQEYPLPQAPQPGWLPPHVEDKHKTDLAHLLSTPELQKALIHAPSTAHPSVGASTQPLGALLVSNIESANKLIRLETRLNATRERVGAHLLSVKAQEQQWRKKQSEMEQRLETFGPRVLHQRLGASIVEQEAVCRGLEESFLDQGDVASEREVTDWVRSLRDARKIGYLRRERRARWDEGRVGGWR